MNEEKNIDAGKQKNQPQDKADERLSDDELYKVAGGIEEKLNYDLDVRISGTSGSGTSGK